MRSDGFPGFSLSAIKRPFVEFTHENTDAFTFAVSLGKKREKEGKKGKKGNREALQER